ncbi:hypothetical protein OAO77_01210 [Candidatus Pelagibacter sp.]|nr:hypothetical protein [Candidatus Pelagibacter sp.]
MKFLKCVFEIFLKNLGSLPIATSIIIAALIYANFNPYSFCMKDLSNSYGLTTSAIYCAGSR